LYSRALQLIETLLFWNVVDTDSRDIVDDFRLTLAATQAAHNRFMADNDLYDSLPSLCRLCMHKSAMHTSAHKLFQGEQRTHFIKFTLVMETLLNVVC
jgi:hypothetical protein